jgi:hypothetical protein
MYLELTSITSDRLVEMCKIPLAVPNSNCIHTVKALLEINMLSMCKTKQDGNGINKRTHKVGR